MSDAAGAPAGWQSPPSELLLAPRAVHIWLLSDAAIVAAAERRGVLADDETRRATRLGEKHSRAFIATRVALRSLLARYTGMPPDVIRFDYGPMGKPAYQAGGVHFSISHAGDRSLLAFSRSHSVGIDVEHVRPARRFAALTARFFSVENARIVGRATTSALPRVFTQAWAQREAYVKAVGGGLYATADRLPFLPGRVPLQHLVLSDGSTWSVASIDAGVDYEARLVAQGDIDSISAFAELRP